MSGLVDPYVDDAIVGHAWIEEGGSTLEGEPVWAAEVQCSQGDGIAAMVWAGSKEEALARAELVAAALKARTQDSSLAPDGGSGG
jgi:hypothetical protein